VTVYLNLRDLTDLLTNLRIPKETRNARLFQLHKWGEGTRDADWVTYSNVQCCEIVAFAEVMEGAKRAQPK
jgi:hypothetical protein